MGDISLREAERRYLESGLDIDLATYNAARRRANLELVRPENYLVRWAYQIARIVSPEAEFELEEDEDEWDLFGGHGHQAWIERQGFRFAILIRQPRINRLQLRFYTPGAASSRPPLASVRINIHNNEVTIITERATGSDHDVIMEQETIQQPNNFIDAEDLFNFGVDLAIEVFSEYLDAFETIFATHINRVIASYYIRALIALVPNTANSSRWELFCRNLSRYKGKLGHTLDIFARTVERYVENRGLHFDNEGGWPAHFDGYGITLTPGYCDQVGEDLDGDPDSNTRGAERGYAYDVADKLASILGEFDEDHGIPKEEWDTDWSADYDLEEFYVDDEDYPEEGQLCFQLPVSRELNPRLLLFIFEGSCQGCLEHYGNQHTQAP